MFFSVFWDFLILLIVDCYIGEVIKLFFWGGVYVNKMFFFCGVGDGKKFFYFE